jgi:hypothetical protein
MFSVVFDNHKGLIIGQARAGEETICELHREIYDLLVLCLAEKHCDTLLKIIPILERAYICGIKMNKKMVDNKCKMTDWSKHTDKQEAVRLRILRRNLVRELERVSVKAKKI